MLKYILLILILIFSSSFSYAKPGTWRWPDTSQREAVEHIDFGEFRIDENSLLASFVLVCVDGIKVYTTYKNSGINSIIIPGGCDGKPEPDKQYYPPIIQQKEVKQDINGKINW